MKKQAISIISYFAAAPIIMLILLESLSRNSFFDAFLWIVRYPGSAIASFIFLLSANILITSVTRRYLLSLWILMFSFVSLGIGCGIKSAIRELPVVPSNLLLVKELFIIVSIIPKIAAVAVISLFVLGSAMYISYMVFEDTPLALISRYKNAILSSSILLFIASATILSNLPNGENIRLVYERYGTLSGFIHLMREPYMETGSDTAYSSGRAKDLENSWLEKVMPTGYGQTKPDVIMIGAESFFDPTSMKEVSFDSDPVPNFHRIISSSMSGSMLVNSFGANTTATEFEVLTSMSMSYMLPDSAAFTDFFSRPVPSLPIGLEKEGYGSIAIHPDKRKFLGRDKAYPMLGFDEYVDVKGFKNPKYVGPYVSDYDVEKKVISKYEGFKRQNPSKPVFVYAMTSQNHFDYRESWYYDDKTHIGAKIPGTLTKAESSMTRGYLHGAHSTDRMLGELYDYFMGCGRPVVFVFWGDHLPALGKNFDVYTKCGYINDYVNNENPNLDEIYRLHSPPLIIADNFKERPSENAPLLISAAYVLPFIYENYGLDMSPLNALLSEQMKKRPLIGLTSWDKREKINSRETADHRMLQYYYLFDKEKK